MRRASLLSALLMTALMLLILPGIWRSTQSTDLNRMNESLRPARMRTLTVWLLDGSIGDRKLLGECISQFEKEHTGVRVFLRAVSAEELTAADAVLPDIVLHYTGALSGAESVLLPLTGLSGMNERAYLAGASAGSTYALPLWLAPNVLGIPAAWLEREADLAPTPSSFFDLGTPIPDVEAAPSVLAPEDLPWSILLSPGGLVLPEGVALQQLLMLCPASMRSRLADASVAAPVPTSTPKAASGNSMPISQGASPTPLPSISTPARVYTLAQFRASAQGMLPYPLTPAVSTRVRWLSICRDGEDASAFVHFLSSDVHAQAALSYGLLLVQHPGAAHSQEPLSAALISLFDGGASLPNAFAHTREELNAICSDAFRRAADPVETLLSLR